MNAIRKAVRNLRRLRAEDDAARAVPSTASEVERAVRDRLELAEMAALGRLADTEQTAGGIAHAVDRLRENPVGLACLAIGRDALAEKVAAAFVERAGFAFVGEAEAAARQAERAAMIALAEARVRRMVADAREAEGALS